MLKLLSYVYLIGLIFKGTWGLPFPVTEFKEKPSFDPKMSNNNSVLLCADGKGPLLEGDGKVVSCAGDCHSGFDCEYIAQGSMDKGGICCPNLKELYRLYNHDGDFFPKDSFIEQISILSSTDDVTDAPSIENSDVPRRKQEKHFDFKHSSNNKPLNGQSVTQVEGSYSCHRQQLELYCGNGKRRTQFVMRWYYREGVCLSYPWGYCPGEPVSSDPTLRTEEECQLLCVKPITNVAKFSLDSSGKTVDNNTAINVKDDSSESGEFKKGFSNSISERAPRLAGTFANALDHQFTEDSAASPANDSITHLFDEVNIDSSQFAAPSLNSSMMVSKLFTNSKSLVSLQKESIASLKLENVTSINGHDNSEDEDDKNNGQFIFHAISTERPQTKKKCDRVTPYRAMCENSRMPSQFTLRWHLRGDKCELYPYGYCHGESVQEEEPIKSEEECITFCIKKPKIKRSQR